MADVAVKSDTSSCNSDNMPSLSFYGDGGIDHKKQRYPHCIVWTPIPCLTWFFPFIGHMGICTSSGVIRDFAGPYYVSEDNMGFGVPTRYWQLSLDKIPQGGSQREVWDRCVYEASEIYKERMHNLFCDNCHSHVAKALNMMKYNNKTNWNMVTLAALMLVKGKHVGMCGFLKTWLPFLILLSVILTIVLVMKFQI